MHANKIRLSILPSICAYLRSFAAVFVFLEYYTNLHKKLLRIVIPAQAGIQKADHHIKD
jgi:hypothetical protein